MIQLNQQQQSIQEFLNLENSTQSHLEIAHIPRPEAITHSPKILYMTISDNKSGIR